MLDDLERRLSTEPGPVARIARDLVGSIRAATATIVRLAREIEDLVRPLAPSLLELPGCGPLTAAKLLGETIAERLKEKKIEAVVFDRNVYNYAGRVKVFSDAAREKGIRF